MKVLLAYATTEGQTRKVAEAVAKTAADAGHDVRLLDVTRTHADFEASDYDAFILAGSVHQGRHQREIAAFAASCRDQLGKKPNMFISVSLAAAFEEKADDVRSYFSEFEEEAAWKPDNCLAVAGAVRSQEYDYFQQQILQFVVLGEHQDYSASENQEFTDWAELDKQVRRFVSANANA